MWLLFVPLLIVVIVVISGMALVGAVFHALGAGWPLLLILAGAWLFWHEDRPRRRTRAAWSASRSMPRTARTPTQQPAPRGGPRPLRQTELPIDVQVKVEQIRRKVEVLLGYADRFPPFSQDLFLVRQTADDYLPRTIQAFLSLPRQTADKPFTPDGKTALQELKTQLDLLDAKLDEIAQALQRQDLDRLLANRRFLEERFGRASA